MSYPYSNVTSWSSSSFALFHIAAATLVLILGTTASGLSQRRQPKVSTVNGSSQAVDAELAGASALVASGNLPAAEAALRKLLQRMPRSSETHNLLGVVLDQRGLSADAEREFQAALRLQPKSVTALSNYGVLLARTKRPAEAIQKFEAVLRLQPTHTQAAYNLGALYAARGDYIRSVGVLEKAASITVNRKTPAATDLGLLLTLVNAYGHANRREDAVALAQFVERSAAEDARVLFTLALSLAEIHEYAEAVRLFERTDQLRPNTYEVLYNLGLALYNLDRHAAASATFTSASALSPNDPLPLYRLGLVASAQGDSKAALGYWFKVIELKPDFAEANFMIGEELLKNRLPERSISFYERAARVDQEKLVYQLRLGVANVRAQRYDKAREIFSRALERFPNNANLYFLLGYSARAEGQYDAAVSAFREVLRLEPDNPDALGNLGYIASQRGQNEEAMKFLNRTIELDPKNYPAHHDLGRLLVKLRKYDEAISVLKRGVELNTKDAGIHYQLFLAYSRLRRKDEAERELAIFREFEDANKHAATPLGATVKTGSASEGDSLPPLPANASGDTTKPKTP